MMTGPLIGRELRPAVGSDALEGPLARAGAGSKELRALAAEQLPVMGGHGGGAAGVGTDGARWVLGADVLEAPVDDELVLLDPTAGTYFGVNQSGSAIWGLLRRGCSADDAAAELSARFDVDAVRARADVDRFVGRLASAGLIRRCPQAEGPGRLR
jgi:Coenzyme PQQ synthesis protein D (PqqD)